MTRQVFLRYAHFARGIIGQLQNTARQSPGNVEEGSILGLGAQPAQTATQCLDQMPCQGRMRVEHLVKGPTGQTSKAGLPDRTCIGGALTTIQQRNFAEYVAGLHEVENPPSPIGCGCFNLYRAASNGIQRITGIAALEEECPRVDSDYR